MDQSKPTTLQMLRESYGYTQKEVCTRFGLDLDEYKKLETKQISVLDRNVMMIVTAMKFEDLCDSDDYYQAEQFFPTSS